MRTTALLVIFLLALGLSLGTAPALAADQAVVQSPVAACQPVSETELSQMNGKFFTFDKTTLLQAARCIYQKLPEDTQTRILCVVRTVRTFKSCFNHTNNTQNGTTTPP